MKRTALFLAGILAISSLSGCGAKNSKSDSSEPFEGKYVVTADYVKHINTDTRGRVTFIVFMVEAIWSACGLFVTAVVC